jgi:hypothetical protein
LGVALLGLLNEIGVFNIKFYSKTPLEVELKQALDSLKLQEEKKPRQRRSPCLHYKGAFPFSLIFLSFIFSYTPFSLWMWHCQCKTIATLMATIASSHDHHYHDQELELLTNPSSTTTPRAEPSPHHCCIYFVEQCNNYYIYKCNMETRGCHPKLHCCCWWECKLAQT